LDKEITFKADNFSIKRIFSSNKPNELIFVTSHNNALTKFNV